MEKREEIHYICDICGAYIANKDRSNEFTFTEGWQSGSHSGSSERTGHVCNKCKGSKLRRFIANFMANFKKEA